MRKFHSIVLTVWLGTIGLPAHASEGEDVQHLALFEIASDGVHDDLARQLGSALRTAVRASPGSSLTEARVSLEQLSLVHDCDPEQLSCLARIAKQLGVTGFIFGQLENEGSGAYAKLRLFDAVTQTIKRSAQVMFALRDASESDIQRKSDALIAQLLGDAPASFEPAPQRIAEEGATALAAAPASEPESDGISGKRVAGYALLGGAALSVGLSVLAFVEIDRAQSNENLDRYRRAVGQMDPSVKDVCDEAEEDHQHGLDSESFEDVKDQCGTGRTFEVLQFVFLGAAAVSGGLSAYFLLSDDGSQERRPRSLLENLPVRPIIRHNAAEIRARLRF
jgi:hypothetical protein